MLEGDLVYTDGGLTRESTQLTPEMGTGDEFIVVNAKWRQQPYSLVIFYINAKH